MTEYSSIHMKTYLSPMREKAPVTKKLSDNKEISKKKSVRSTAQVASRSLNALQWRISWQKLSR